MPNSASRPARAAGSAASMARRKASGRRITWSAGMSSMTPSGSRAATDRAATAAAKAVLRATGSSTSTAPSAPMSRSCSAMMKRCSALAITTRGEKRASSPSTRAAVSCSMVRSPASGSSCLGKLSRESGPQARAGAAGQQHRVDARNGHGGQPISRISSSMSTQAKLTELSATPKGMNKRRPTAMAPQV